ncbi:MAG: hypothetical protein CMK07_12810 [Ponticaulis sp.]|nr:hypothetical protein [Ponticaulis sp.]
MLIVLLLVATLSVLSVSIVQSVMSTTRAMRLSDARGQTGWYVSGAEELARVKLGQLFELTEGRITRYTPGLGVPFSFAIDGGQISVQLEEASNCFNINSLATGEDALAETGGPDPHVFYTELLTALDFGPNEVNQLVAAAADWVDRDSNLRGTGAEAGYYASLQPPRSPANTDMVSPKELLDVKGYDPEVYRRIAPYVCARPGAEVGVFNINTLTASQSPLLVPVFGGEITTEAMYGIMEQYGELEHPDVTGFLEHPSFAVIATDTILTSVLDMHSSYFRMSGEVVYLDSVTRYEAIFALGDEGRTFLVRRRLGVDE